MTHRGNPEQTAAVPETGRHAFGTFKGVFLPSILTIFGVIMYLRMGWVVGHAGIAKTITIVTISSLITLITGLSLSSIATNMRVGVGGAYFMVSRSLGVEVGAAIGISLYFAKAIGIAFYIAGFTESVHSLFPQAPEQIIGIASLIVVALLAFISADIALKAAIVIFAVIAASLVSFFWGLPTAGPQASAATQISHIPFWAIFAVFFPAVTGIEAGLSMSGDLKDPARSLPRGTIAAVLVGYIIYLAVPLALYNVVPKSVLTTDSMIFYHVSKFKWVVLLGIWGACLSSALGSILGAPRTLQALGRDRTVFPFLGRGHGPKDTPRIATAVSFLIALVAILVGKLNSIAPVLTMFFLTTYGSLNLVAGLEGMIGNPSWRPSFRTPWPISLIGAALCIAAMFMINAGATLIAILVVALIYYLTVKRKLGVRWLDIRRSIHLALARFSIFRLAETKEHARSWRPNMLVLSGAPTKRLYLIELADAFTHGKGLLTVATLLRGEGITTEKILSMENTVKSYLKERHIPALVEVMAAEDLVTGVKNIVTSYGIGPLTPNTFILGECDDPEKFTQFSEVVMTIYRARRNLVIVRKSGVEKTGRGGRRKILFWWGGQRHNAGLMLALGYMLQTSPEWRGSSLRLKTIAKDDKEREVVHKEIEEFLKGARLLVEPEVVVHPYVESPLPTTIRETSADADLVMIGMRPPEEEETAEEYSRYYAQLMERTANYPLLAIVLASEDLKFQDIFV
jgi:amino acid transporter